MKNEAVIQVTCPECGRKEVRYTAVQLRSADEGSTIFYSCDCGHKYVEAEFHLCLIANIGKVEYKQLSRKLDTGYEKQLFTTWPREFGVMNG